MKLLLFQAEHFSWKSFSKTLDHVPEQEVDERVEETVVAFVHAEAGDPENPKVATKLVKNIKWIANKRGLKNVVLHSFSHLSDSTAPADYAGPLLERIAERLTATGYHVWRTPFGYFCSWDLGVYGESLAKVFKSF